MTTYSIIKKVNGSSINQINPKTYSTKEDAINAGNSWLRDCTVHAERRKLRGFEVIENTEETELGTTEPEEVLEGETPTEAPVEEIKPTEVVENIEETETPEEIK